MIFDGAHSGLLEGHAAADIFSNWIGRNRSGPGSALFFRVRNSGEGLSTLVVAQADIHQQIPTVQEPGNYLFWESIVTCIADFGKSGSA